MRTVMERLTTIIIALTLAACAGEDDDTAGDSTTTTWTTTSSTSDASTSTSGSTSTTSGGESTGAKSCSEAAEACFTEYTEEACSACEVACDGLDAETRCNQWQACLDLWMSGCQCAAITCTDVLPADADDESREGICRGCIASCEPYPGTQKVCDDKI